MQAFALWISLTLSLFGLLPGCTAQKPAPLAATERPTESEDSKNRELSYGYGQLYKTASGLKHLKTALLVKAESDKVGSLIEDISSYAGKLTGQLEKLDREYPSLRIDDPGLPEMEAKRRKAVVWDQIFVMAPVVGKTGKDFERTLLLSQAGVLNNMRFLAEVIKDGEKSDARRTFLHETQTRLNGLYQRVIRLLEQDYFC